jgi:hypothetical protein
MIDGGSVLLETGAPGYRKSQFREHSRRIVWTFRQRSVVSKREEMTAFRHLISAASSERRTRIILSEMHDAGGDISKLLHGVSQHMCDVFQCQYSTVLAVRGRLLLQSTLNGNTMPMYVVFAFLCN